MKRKTRRDISRMLEQPMQQCPNCKEYVPAEYVVCVWCGFDLTSEIIKRSGIKISWIDALRRMSRVVYQPFSTLREIILLPDSKGPILVLYALSFLVTLQINIFVWKMRYNVQSNIARMIAVIMIAVYPLFLLFLLMIALRVGTRFGIIVIRLLGGKSEKDSLQALFGYSLIPVAIGEGAASFFRLFYSKQEVLSISYGTISSYFESISKNGLSIFIDLIRFVTWIWSAVLFSYGLKREAKISTIEAILVTGVLWFAFISAMF